MAEERLDPDILLKKIRACEKNEKLGHLKIFFGYAAGVGKTYAMLEAAHLAKSHGVDVVVGYVEPHPRPETAELLEGLEKIPTKEIEYNGIKLMEFDIDAAVARAPKLVLVDELAHTNVEGSRHLKRYQDVGELLKAGINVYTTVNVQHIESLNDMVASITGVMVRERIPDHIFDNAEQVELVDIEPEELIERLSAGKIYRETQAQNALVNFFSVENLAALREIALRRCADRVNKMSDKVRFSQSTDYYTDEHILVCLSTAPTNTKIIRTAARMAGAFKAKFTALFVETPDFFVMTDEDKNRLRANLRIAQQLGATIETVYGDDRAVQIAEFARLTGVSKIVLGRNNAKKKFFFSKPPLIEKLTMMAPNLDIYIIPDKDCETYDIKRAGKKKIKFNFLDMAKSIALLAIATLIGFAFYSFGFSEANIITIYILSVLITSIITTGRIYSIVSSILSVMVFNFFFTIPRFTLNAYDSGYPMTFLIMFISACVTSSLMVKIKQHATQSAETAYRTKILLETNQLLQQAKDKKGIVIVTSNQLTKLLKKDIVFYSSCGEELSSPSVFMAGENRGASEYITSNEKAVAAWVFKNNKHAGATTNTLGNSKCLYLAVRARENVYGVVGIAVDEAPLEHFEHSIVLSVLGECALALENEQVAREKGEAAILAKNEQLRANLLRAISHDLRTPLTSISGNAGVLRAEGEKLNEDKKQKLYDDIYDESLWLINLVENLLSVTRIEDGTMNLKLAAELVDEVIDEAMQHVNRQKESHKITVIPSEDLTLAKMDARLIVQVIINIVDNAVKYTPKGCEVIISTHKQKDFVAVEIADNGCGISEAGKARIFDMFYTDNTKSADSRRSLGLGLALCKSIITAHGGEISVQNCEPHGAMFRFTLPIEEVKLHE